MVAKFGKRKPVLFWGAGLVGLVWLGYCAYLAEIVDRQTIVFSKSLAGPVMDSIKLLLQQKRHDSFVATFEQLKENFPMVERLHVQPINLNHIRINVISADLAWRLGEWVLARNGGVFAASNFTDAELSYLPTINLLTSINTSDEVVAEQKKFLLTLPDFVLDGYDIHWQGMNQIILIDKKNHARHLVVRHDLKLTEKLLQAGEQAFNDYLAQAKPACREKTLKADLRFDQQIIVSC